MSTYAGTTEVHTGTLSFNSIANVGGGASALGAPMTVEDGIIRMSLGTNVQGALTYTGSGQIRSELAAAMASNPAYAGLGDLAFARPVSARTWLQASNPSERWKWDIMFQDLPPVKFEGRPVATSWFSGIPVKEVK